MLVIEAGGRAGGWQRALTLGHQLSNQGTVHGFSATVDQEADLLWAWGGSPGSQLTTRDPFQQAGGEFLPMYAFLLIKPSAVALGWARRKDET